jgi:valyl-tRNA synthetase
VLDTWFSSALWPLSTLGWPEKSDDLAAFYPTSLLITGFDILFFWVARMIMMGCHFTGKAPFAQVHLTGLVRDARGQKMSKTRGNVMDPLDLVRQYGADAVRFTLAALASPGRDLPLDVQRMEGYRAFGTKLWNASRLVQMHLKGDEQDLTELDPISLALPERWLLAELETTVASVNRSWEQYRFDEGCRQLYQFVWNGFCDWYLEMSKPVLQDGDRDGRQAAAVRSVARGVLLEVLKLLHPVMPFITEEIAAHLGSGSPLIGTGYPRADGRFQDPRAQEVVRCFQALVQGVRSYRHLVGLPPGFPLAVAVVHAEHPETLGSLAGLVPELMRMAGLSSLRLEEATPPEGAVRDLAGGVEIALVLPDGAIGESQRQRLGAELAQARKDQSALAARLADQGFVSRAPADVVEGSRARLGELGRKVTVLAGTLGEPAS